MTDDTRIAHEPDDDGAGAVEELTRRGEVAHNGYLAIAENIGWLYICADRNGVRSLTWNRDKPMRIASDNEQALATSREDLRELRGTTIRAG